MDAVDGKKKEQEAKNDIKIFKLYIFTKFLSQDRLHKWALLNTSVQEAVKFLAAEALDILIFPEIGMLQ